MNVLIFLDHDITVRHFIDSGVFRPLAQWHNTTLVVPEGSNRVKRALTPEDVGFRVRHLRPDNLHVFLWRTLFQVGQLRLRPGRQYRAIRRIYRSHFPWKVTAYYTFLGLPVVYRLFRTWVRHRLRHKPYDSMERLIDETAPDVIVHPSVLEGIFINDLIEIARRRGIPSVVIMNSWDNPSTKRAIVDNPDWLLVWGEQTARHAERYMSMRPRRTIRFGAAQLDVYRLPPRITRAEFCRHHGIDPGSKILLYAGSSKGTDEFQHLRNLDQAVEEGLLNGTFVVYRPHPWGNAGKGGERIIDYPWRNVVIESTMRNYLRQIRHGENTMSYPDYSDTHDLLCAVDAVVSPLSTILLEAALHGKPVMCFLPDEDDGENHFSLALPLVHFDELFAMDEVIVAHGDHEFIPKTVELMKRTDEPDIRGRLRAACACFVDTFKAPYGERLVEFLETTVVPGSAVANVATRDTKSTMAAG